jgi:hypothetical protein
MRGALVLTLLAVSAPAFAANTSVYTSFNIDKCPVLDPPNTTEEWGGSSLCKGYNGNKIYFAEGDLRAFIAIGKNPKGHCSATQTFGGFNTVFPKIEWRLSRGKPIATIQRWNVSYDPENSEKIKSWLVVTKLEADNSCHMAYVEGAYPNANAKARELADTMSAGFSCKGGVVKVVAKSPTDASSLASGNCE